MMHLKTCTAAVIATALITGTALAARRSALSLRERVL